MKIKARFNAQLFVFKVQCVKDKQAYFAELLYKSMKGAGTNETLLIRVIVSRCEIDMVQIKEKFESMYSATLASFIKVILGTFIKLGICGFIYLLYFEYREIHHLTSDEF